MFTHTPHTPCTIACVLPTSVKQHSIPDPSHISPTFPLTHHLSPFYIPHSPITSFIHPQPASFPLSTQLSHPSSPLLIHPSHPSPSTPPHSPNLVQPLPVKLFLHLIVPLLTVPQLICRTNKSKLFTLLVVLCGLLVVRW